MPLISTSTTKNSLEIQFLKIFAIICMVIDHTGILFFTGDELFRWIGRFSFILFALLLAHNYYVFSKNQDSYLKRLVFYGLISQIPFTFLTLIISGDIYLNIFMTLGLGLGLGILLTTPDRRGFLVSSGIIGALVVYESLGRPLLFDYGTLGVIAVSCVVVFFNNPTLSRLWLLAPLIMVNYYYDPVISNLVIPVLSTLLFFMISIKKTELSILSHKKEFNKYMYWFYPLHISLLLAIFFTVKSFF